MSEINEGSGGIIADENGDGMPPRAVYGLALIAGAIGAGILASIGALATMIIHLLRRSRR